MTEKQKYSLNLEIWRLLLTLLRKIQLEYRDKSSTWKSWKKKIWDIPLVIATYGQTWDPPAYMVNFLVNCPYLPPSLIHFLAFLGFQQVSWSLFFLLDSSPHLYSSSRVCEMGILNLLLLSPFELRTVHSQHQLVLTPSGQIRTRAIYSSKDVLWCLMVTKSSIGHFCFLVVLSEKNKIN